MTNAKVSVIQKARYGVLMLPAGWLLFSIWVVINEAFPRYAYDDVLKTPPSGSQISSVIIYTLGTLWVIWKILRNVKDHVSISAELKSAFAFLLGTTIMAISSYFHFGQFFSYVGIAIVDIAAIIMIVTLLQGKPFGPLTLYHSDVQIQKSS